MSLVVWSHCEQALTGSWSAVMSGDHSPAALSPVPRSSDDQSEQLPEVRLIERVCWLFGCNQELPAGADQSHFLLAAREL
jgi:hypothetical protein